MNDNDDDLASVWSGTYAESSTTPADHGTERPPVVQPNMSMMTSTPEWDFGSDESAEGKVHEDHLEQPLLSVQMPSRLARLLRLEGAYQRFGIKA